MLLAKMSQRSCCGFREQERYTTNKVFKQPVLLPGWGLSVKESSGSRDGRVLRPWRGKLYIDIEGHIRWEGPETIVDL